MIVNKVFENSSMLSNAAYDTEKEELSIAFTSGKVYTYIGVLKAIYDDLVNAPSPGKYFNSIKNTLIQK